jgi:hypothetical protein
MNPKRVIELADARLNRQIDRLASVEDSGLRASRTSILVLAAVATVVATTPNSVYGEIPDAKMWVFYTVGGFSTLSLALFRCVRRCVNVNY